MQAATVTAACGTPKYLLALRSAPKLSATLLDWLNAGIAQGIWHNGDYTGRATKRPNESKLSDRGWPRET